MGTDAQSTAPDAHADLVVAAGVRARARRVARTCWVAGLACALLLLAPGRASAQFGSLLAPGPLAKAHAKLEGVGNCIQCHTTVGKVSAQKCLTCHEPVASRITARTGVHKAAGDTCSSCHVEHSVHGRELRGFDEKTFDHAGVTGFALTGKHVPGAEGCVSCHKGRSFLEAKAACASCHGDHGEGKAGLGPNFTDNCYLHGGKLANLYTTIRNGVSEIGRAHV